MNKNAHAIQEVLETISSHKKFVLTSHVNPDGDGLGCEMALYHYLTSLNKEVQVINASPVPKSLQFLDPKYSVYQLYNQDQKEAFLNAEVIIVLDISVLHRLGEVAEAVDESKAIKICIDHHVTNYFPGNILYIDEKAAATGELVFDLFKAGGVEITKQIAEALYVTILADTGSFRFSNTNAKILRIGAELLDIGLSHNSIYRHLFENNPWNKINLFARALNTLCREADGKIAYMKVTQKMFEETDSTYEDLEGFSDYPRNIQGVLVSILFIEHFDGNVKISFRSSGSTRVDQLAGHFGGGGHKNASAAVINDALLEDTIPKVISEASKRIDNA